MADEYVFAIEGLNNLKSIKDLPDEVLLAAVRAINETTERARAQSAREIRRQVNLPQSYLTGQNARLRIKQRANRTRLEGIVEGRHRPTSLARFASGTPGTQGGVMVQVKPGFARFMRKAFLIRLRAGSGITDTKFNLGLAIRLRPGERVRNKKEMVGIGANLYLLYGPSVDQIFRTVAEDISGNTADFLESEFLRLMDL